MYELLMEKLEGYITEEKLKQSRHPYSTQPNEAIHNAINQSAPKRIDYSRTNSLCGRMSVAIGVNSEGLENYISEVTNKLYCLSCSTQSHFLKKDYRKNYKSNYDKQLHVKQRRRDEKRTKTKTKLKQSRADKKKGTTYQSGMAIHLIANEDL